MTTSVPVITAVDACAYRVPTPTPEADGTLEWDSTTIVVVHVDISCVPLITGTLGPVIQGQPLDVPARWSDMQRVQAARAVVGDDVELYVDANGAYSPGQARRVARELEDYQVLWFEEPVTSDDLAGLAEVRRTTTVDVAAGEYGYDLAYFARMVGARAVDCLQVGVTRCGGYTEWARAATA